MYEQLSKVKPQFRAIGQDNCHNWLKTQNVLSIKTFVVNLVWANIIDKTWQKTKYKLVSFLM